MYLNHAAVAPLSRRAAGAMQGLAEDCLLYGSYHYDQWLKVYQGIRVLTARLIGAEAGEIAITKNTSEGIATIANGLSFRQGDRIVCFKEEFPANFFPWRVLERDGVVLEWLSIYDSVERIAEAARGAKLLAISWVNYLSGHRVDLVRPRQGHEGGGILGGGDGVEEMLARGIPIPKYANLQLGLPAQKVLLRRWSLQRPDVVQVVTEGPLGWSALTAARKLKLPVISEFHTNFHRYTGHYGVGWLTKPIAAYLRKFHNRADLTLVPTRALCRELAAQGIPRVDVVSRGVDTALFDPARRSETLRRQWGLAPDDLAVMYVGRISPEKNLALLEKAFAAIRSSTAARMSGSVI